MEATSQEGQGWEKIGEERKGGQSEPALPRLENVSARSAGKESPAALRAEQQSAEITSPDP
jgi:hypothetical protein